MFKPISLSSSITYVSTFDPAIDWEAIVAGELERDPELLKIASDEVRASTAKELFKTRLHTDSLTNPLVWKERLRFKSGEEPTEFLIGAIPSDDATRIADECRAGSRELRAQELQWRSFLTSIRDIQRFGSEKIPKRKVGQEEFVEPAWLRKTFVLGLRSVALEVGMVAWAWNQLTVEETKN